MLHPAADCYRGLGYCRARRASVDRTSRVCSAASSPRATATSSRVCERIIDADGASFTDTSAWYWSSLLGRSRGPWLATTRAAPAAVQVAAVR